jgi:signal transduction histidine kinase/DNA-binding response OmpR family regulator/HPt (histidine-containing phosphotransfer) domain-containing protein
MDSSTGKTSSDAKASPRDPALRSVRRSARELFESLTLGTQFRLAAIAAVTVTLLAVLAVSSLWDTRVAREEALAQAQGRADAIAQRLQARGGGALDDLSDQPQILAAALALQDGQVLQRYLRADAVPGPGANPPVSATWTSPPGGAWHRIKGFLALEPLYVESVVELQPGLAGKVSLVIDHRWIWAHLWGRLGQVPFALLLGCLVGLLAANLLRRQVAEPLQQLAATTRVSGAPQDARHPSPRRCNNELTALATNFDALADRLAEYERELVTVRHSSGQQIIERTRELEARLRKAEALTRSKDEFLANMSHEIRTPMNGVLGMAELLAGTELDRRQRRFVDSMRAAAETMMQIINDILDDSKIEAGKMELVSETFDVRELAEQAGQLYSGQAERKKLEMICRIEPTVPSVVAGDALRLRQVLGNLLSNAVKYTEHGEVEIRVGLDDMRDGQCRLHFSVRDTGPGIPDPEHSGVFEAFTQLDNGTRMGGTGLGLSIATRLVKLMGGERIDLASAMGRGSTFSFVLPFEVREAAPVPNRASDEFSGLRVLVVDDSSTSYMLLEEMLANWSAEVSVLNRAKLVADRMQNAALRGTPFDVVLLDHSLPDGTTDDLLRTIRLDPATAGTYVVLMSALNFDATYEGTHVIAPDVCIAKPVRQVLLRGALKASREPRKPLVAPPPAPAERTPAARVATGEYGLHVMVVDDNAINREVAVAMLEDLGCSVVLAEEGRAAVAHAQHDRFDVIFMDCQMPGMDGYAATEAIRADEKQRGAAPTTIVALTANVLSRDRDRCVAAGMDSFLAKPFRAAQLEAVLEPVAARRAATTTPIIAAPAVESAPTVEAPAEVRQLSDTQANAILEAPTMSTGNTARLPVLDLEQVATIRGLGKPQIFEQLCDMLFSSSKDAFARLDAALAAGNVEEIAAAAHALKSPVANLGGRRLAELLDRCENAARDGGDLVAVRRAAAGLKAHYAALVAAIETENKRPTGTG